MSSKICSAIIQLLVFNVIPFLWWLITARNKENFFQWIGLKKPVFTCSIPKLLRTIIIACAAYILSMMLVLSIYSDKLSIASDQFANRGFSALAEIFLYAFIQTALSEELLFRGFLGKRLIHQFGFGIGNTIQALLFGLMHGIPFGITSDNILLAVMFTILPGAIGWFQGWVNEKRSSGSIVTSWVIHSLMNFVSALAKAF